MATKTYIKPNEKIYCTGCFLRVSKSNALELYCIQEEMYYDGLPVEYDENEGYYTEAD